jgi:hypothetical protein
MKMEVVQGTKMVLYIETDKRAIEKEFRNLNDLRLFMRDFFSLSDVADRRAGESIFPYSGPERRVQI